MGDIIDDVTAVGTVHCKKRFSSAALVVLAWPLGRHMAQCSGARDATATIITDHPNCPFGSVYGGPRPASVCACQAISTRPKSAIQKVCSCSFFF
jgi:hypothetical protein